MIHRTFALSLLSALLVPVALLAEPPGSLTPPAKPIHPTTLPSAFPPPATQPAKPAAPAAPKPGATTPAATQPAVITTGEPKAKPQDADPKWLERIPKDDRAALDEIIGYAPAAFDKELTWIGGDAANWDVLRGKVVVIQSFTTANMAGRKWPTRVGGSLKEFQPTDVRIIALHTPEDAAGAEEFLKKQKPPENVLVAVDSKGEFCDAMGVFKQPVNIVVDRCGTVRFAGLNVSGLEKAVDLLVKEPFSPTNKPVTKATEAVAAKPAGNFPAFVGSVTGAKDIRGKKAPDFAVQQFVTKGKPNLSNKVVIVDFWATWCGPCRASIPHMNALVDRFGDKICCIGISDESKSKFDEGMQKQKLKFNDFHYNLALDPGRAMYGSLGVSAIPHCIVMSKDWIVRWQGHPASLDEGTLDKIIAADEGAGGDSKSSGGKRRGWTAG